MVIINILTNLCIDILDLNEESKSLFSESVSYFTPLRIVYSFFEKKTAWKKSALRQCCRTQNEKVSAINKSDSVTNHKKLPHKLEVVFSFGKMAKTCEPNENSVDYEIAKNCIKIVQVFTEIREIYNRILSDREKWDKSHKSISDYKKEQLILAKEHKQLLDKIDKMQADWAEIEADEYWF